MRKNTTIQQASSQEEFPVCSEVADWWANDVILTLYGQPLAFLFSFSSSAHTVLLVFLQNFYSL